MKVKAGDKVYDPNSGPIMVILTDQDKEFIANMAPDSYKYCAYPATAEWRLDNHKKIKEWMEEI
jgi:hypothetical protein